jgi:hypothetical protein
VIIYLKDQGNATFFRGIDISQKVTVVAMIAHPRVRTTAAKERKAKKLKEVVKIVTKKMNLKEALIQVCKWSKMPIN